MKSRLESAYHVIGNAVDEQLKALPPLLNEGVIKTARTEQGAETIARKVGDGAAFLPAFGALLHFLLQVVSYPHEVAVSSPYLQVSVFVLWEGCLYIKIIAQHQVSKPSMRALGPELSAIKRNKRCTSVVMR